MAGMSDASAPPPATGPGSGAAPVVVALAAPGGGMKRLIGKPRGEHRLTLRPQEITVEHAGALRAPLRFAPGSVVVASVDPGGASPGKRAVGRFPVLHRLTADRVIPREEGIDGWMWTSTDGTAYTLLGDDAPNLVFMFSPPLAGERIESAFEPDVLADLAKRSPLGQPAVFALLLRVEKPDVVGDALARYGLAGQITDREVPPVQRRHLPGDKPANPAISVGESTHAATSVPPPGVG
jgi:hypothetical protein